MLLALGVPERAVMGIMGYMLVSDTQRIWVHADNGYAIDQVGPERVVQAYERLSDAGFTRRLI